MVIAASGDPTLSPDVLDALSGTEDWLSSWTTVAALLGLGIALLIVLYLKRARWRRWGRVLTIIVASMSLLVGGVIGLNAYSGYVPNVGAARITLANLGIRASTPFSDKRGGTSSPVEIPAQESELMPESTTWVYTPRGYNSADSTQKYPVVYLIHGSSGSSSDWFAGGQIAHVMDVLIAAKVIQPMIIVSPDINGTGPSASDTECLDSTTGGSQVASYLMNTLVPWIDAHYNTAADRDHRIIGGMSAGGYCALNVGLQNNSAFSTILSIGGFPDPGNGGHGMLATDEEFRQQTPSVYLPTLTFTHPVSVFIATAENADAEKLAAMSTLADQLRARGNDVVEQTEEGHDHTWAMARSVIPYGLVFASDRLP